MRRQIPTRKIEIISQARERRIGGIILRKKNNYI